MKKFKLLKTYEWPGGTIHENVSKTIEEWQVYFPLEKEDFENKTDWFEEIEPSHDERYEMCKDQNAQIDCRNECCFHHDKFGHCLNISPAITLNQNGKFRCWSKLVDEDKIEDDGYEEEDLADEEDLANESSLSENNF
ncbi:MAG: hypothetical protein WC554_14215 [Clostridia bacterium]